MQSKPIKARCPAGKSTYLKLGQYREAVQAFQQAIQIRPDDALAYFGLGMAYSSFAQYRQAIAAFQEALRIKPEFANAHISLALVYMALHDRAAAIQQYEILKNISVEKANRLYQLINYLSQSSG
jgi:tetratricopeptide (TPR) repeat protein